MLCCRCPSTAARWLVLCRYEEAIACEREMAGFFFMRRWCRWFESAASSRRMQLAGVQGDGMVTQGALIAQAPSEPFTMGFGERTMRTRYEHDIDIFTRCRGIAVVMQTGRKPVPRARRWAMGEKSTSLAQCRCGLGLGRSKARCSSGSESSFEA
jgi:hypothetical protein